MLKSNTVLKMLSLLLAIALWAFVLGEVNPAVKKTIYDVPVEFTNADFLDTHDLAMVTRDGYSVDVVVKGARSDIGQLELKDIQVTADLYGYEKGENHIAVDVTVPDDISLEEVKTPEITVILEDMVSVSKPVIVEFTGNAPDNMEASAVKATPSEVEVKGAESVVARVDRVTVQVDVEDLTEESEISYETPTAWTKKGKLIKDVSISAATVEVESVLHHIKTVPLEVKVTGNPDGEPEIKIPEEVTVKGSAEALARITSITAEAVDISDAEKTQTIPLDFMLPNGVELADVSKDIGIEIKFK